jgi:hypothetical protein
MVAQSRRFVLAPKYFFRTDFILQSLWDVDLSNVDVVAVYGLNPIMKDLGLKLQRELKPGSLVVSNVFTIPGWKPSIELSRDGIHVYRIPSCWNSKDAFNPLS